MKNFLQILREFHLNRKLGFEKYLFAFCMLLGMQGITFAQITEVPGTQATSTGALCERGVQRLNVSGVIDISLPSFDSYVYQVNSDQVTLSVNAFLFGDVEVTWERKTTKTGPWEFVIKQDFTKPLVVENITNDVLYRATFEDGFGGTKDQRALLVTGSLNPDVKKACPKEAVEFNIQGARFHSRSEWLFGYGNEPEKRVQEYTDGQTTYTLNASNQPLKGHVVLKYDEFNCSSTPGSTSPRFEVRTEPVEVETNCKEECMTTSTGDFYDGTDFDPSGNGSTIPNGVNHHFAQNNIVFGEGDITDYWLGTNVNDFFGQVPFLDQGIAEGTNNYMFCENPNKRIVSLGFPAEKYRNKPYRYKMRLYIQVNHECKRPIVQAWEQAKFIARTEMGTVTSDTLEIIAYDNEGNPLKGRSNQVINGEIQPVVVGGTDIRVSFPEFLDLAALATYDVIRVEICFFGKFPDRPDPRIFTFLPMFEQFECAKVAIDYISAEVENVCLSPNVVCIGDNTIANAAGFPRNSYYEWYESNGTGWVKMDAISGAGDKYAQVEIPVNHVGKKKYMVRVTAQGYKKELEFYVGGKDCKVPSPSGIDGSAIYCLPNSGYTYRPVPSSDLATYKWELYKPDGTLMYKSDDNDPHFVAGKELSDGDVITVKLDENDPTFVEGEYKLLVRTFGNGKESGNPIYIPLKVYRTPDVSLKLVSSKFNDSDDEGDKKLCPSDKRREIVAVAQNSFTSDAMSLYTYTWSSNPGAANPANPVFVPRPHRDSADVHIEAVADICDEDGRGYNSVDLSVTADVQGCKSTATNTYDIEALGDLYIDCAKLENELQNKPLTVPNGKEEGSFKLPLPDFDSGCDSDPDLTITITPKRQAVSDTMAPKTIVLKKSEIDANKIPVLVLPWGEYVFNYLLTDGCGRTYRCDAKINILKTDGPDVDCSLIQDLDVINGKYNNESSSRCSIKLNAVDIKIPVLLDRNDERNTLLTGVYSGRVHFDTKQNKDVLISSAEELAKFDPSIDLYDDEYEIDFTYILWKFTNDAGNSSYCVQEVWVEDKEAPYFDCNQIDPFVFRPVTKKGECEIKFEDFWPELKAKNYIAYDSCPEPVTPIPGELHTDSILSTKVSDTYKFKVGIADTIYWQFRDRHDNVKYCPQVINAFSGDSVKFDCENIADVEGLANPGTCEVEAAKLNIPSPVATEPCPDKDGNTIYVPGVGTRSDGKALTDPYPTGDTYITWLFEAKNSYSKTCVTHVLVKGNKHFEKACDVWFPNKNIVVPDCDQTDVPLEPRNIPDPCVAGYMAPSEPYLTQYVVNSTNPTKMDTIFTPIDLETENPYHFPQVGEWFVSWVFWDYTHNISDTCVQSIHLRDNKPPIFDCNTIGRNDSMFVTLKGKCLIPFKDLRDSLGYYYATEACTGDKIPGVPYLYDPVSKVRTEFPSEVSVGIYTVIWVFANDSLTTEETTCIKTLLLQHDMEPKFDCNTLESPLVLIDDKGLCVINLDQDLLPIPEAHDACKPDYIVYGRGYVQLYEDPSNDFIEFCYYDENTHQPVYNNAKFPNGGLPLGGHLIKWVFKSPFSTVEKICYQKVKANSDAIDKINCDDFVSRVKVNFLGSGSGASYKEVLATAGGRLIPDWEKYDVCKKIDTLFTRDDNKDIYRDVYPFGSTTIFWLFKDTTRNSEKTKLCETVVVVENGKFDIQCPDSPTTPFTCLDAIPAPYKTLQEFVDLGGGKLTSNGQDVSALADPSTFKLDTTSVGDKCEYEFIRKYSVMSYSGQLASCSQRFKVKDEEAPEWQNLGSNFIKKDDAAKVIKFYKDDFTCEISGFFRDDLIAKDICSNEVFSDYKKVNSLDGVRGGLFYTVTTSRSADPTDCDYYRYYETRRYVAVDACNNKSYYLEFEAKVQDDDAPIINMPDTASWRKKFVPAVYAHKDCKFLYPDLVTDFPRDSIKDDCSPEAVKYFRIEQEPKAGDTIKNTREPQYITLKIFDVCGNFDTIKKKIFVQDNKDIINVSLDQVTVCAEKELSINDLLKTGGFIYSENWFDPGQWDSVPNTFITYDYYKGIDKQQLTTKTQKELDDNYLIFSNNRVTHPTKFKDVLNSVPFIGLDSLSDDGLYTIVAMDTSLHCTDTTTAYITVHSKPTIDLDQSSLLVCERDSIHLISDQEVLFEKYNVNIIENGEVVDDTSHGWMLDGVKYHPETILGYKPSVIKMQYWATNICGTGTSNNWIQLSMRERMNPDDIMLITDPNNPPRVFAGESARLTLVSKYKPESYMWYRVKGSVDGNSDEMFDKNGNVRNKYIDRDFVQDTLLEVTNYGEHKSNSLKLRDLGDTAQYYVLLVDNVCPAVPSNVVAIDVVTKLPTAFTPHNSIGMNDIFMEGHKVIIFNRYGQKMVESDNGWDGTCRGVLVDPGVYFYEVIINQGQKHKGSIEVVYFK